jgi:hypothetical protein
MITLDMITLDYETLVALERLQRHVLIVIILASMTIKISYNYQYLLKMYWFVCY